MTTLEKKSPDAEDHNLPAIEPPHKLIHVVAVPATLRFFRGQLDFVGKRGYDVSVVASPDPDFERMVNELSVRGHAIWIEREISPGRDLVSLFRLWRLFRRERPVIVHGHTPKGGLLSMIAAWLARIPVRVYHIRGLRFVTTSGLKRHILVAAEKVSSALAHRVIAVSRSVGRQAIETRVCPEEKLTVLAHGSGNGVDARVRFNPDNVEPDAIAEFRRTHDISEDALVFGFVGRLVNDKGITELAAAWQTIKKHHPNAHLVLVGELETGDPVPPDVRNILESDERVHFTGVVWDMPRAYASFDVLLFPTYREGLPNVLLEAAAMEIPVVATRVTGCVDVVQDGETGILVPVRDADALAEAGIRYANDRDLRTRHGKAARRWVLERFQPERVWSALADEYDGLMRDRVRR